MEIKNAKYHFVVVFNDKEINSGISEVLEAYMPMFSSTSYKDGREWHIRIGERDTFNRLLKMHFQDRQLSLF